MSEGRNVKNPYQIVQDFEQAVAEYTGAPYVVAVNSCTMALTLAVAWHLRDEVGWVPIEIPKHTYVSVPQSIIHAGGWPVFRDEKWIGAYQMKPLPVWDSARWFTAGIYRHPLTGDNVNGRMLCVSFHASKTLGDTQGGAILLDDPEADKWLRLARFDGREQGVAPKDQQQWPVIGWHCYMSPDVAARLSLKFYSLPQHNEPLPNDDYPDLSQFEIFK